MPPARPTKLNPDYVLGCAGPAARGHKTGHDVVELVRDGARAIERVGGHDHRAEPDASCKLREVAIVRVICPTRLGKNLFASDGRRIFQLLLGLAM